MKVNVGTYSFGMRSTLTLAEKLAKAAELGFDGIELLANDLRDNTAEELKQMCAAAGIEPISSHVAIDLIDDEMLEKFAAIGGRMMIVPSFAFANKEEALELARQLTEKAELAAKYGIKIGYHNHTTEFFVDESGKPIMEYTIEATEPGKVWFQLDCGWATAAGVNCPEFIKKYSGRFISVHVKENDTELGTGTPRSMKEPRPSFPRPQMGPDGKPVMTEEMQKRMAEMQARMKVQCPMGAPTSRVDWKAIKAATDAQGFDVAWTVERENDYLGDIVACLGEDVKWLKANIQ